MREFINGGRFTLSQRAATVLPTTLPYDRLFILSFILSVSYLVHTTKQTREGNIDRII